MVKYINFLISYQGLNISQELKLLPNQLIPIYQEIEKKIRNLNKATDFYTNYVHYFFKRLDC